MHSYVSLVICHSSLCLYSLLDFPLRDQIAIVIPIQLRNGPVQPLKSIQPRPVLRMLLRRRRPIPGLSQRQGREISSRRYPTAIYDSRDLSGRWRIPRRRFGSARSSGHEAAPSSVEVHGVGLRWNVGGGLRRFRVVLRRGGEGGRQIWDGDSVDLVEGG
jgi:hypothetical protein